MTINVRDAIPEDSNIIVQLISELACTSNEVSPISPAYVEAYMATANSHILLVEINGKVIGLLSYSIRPDLYHAGNCCIIEELIIQEEMRGQGAGSALITELFSRLKDCVEVNLGVMPDNTRAIHFYRRHGLTEEALLLEKHFKK